MVQLMVAVLAVVCTVGAMVICGLLASGCGGVVNSGSTCVLVLPAMSVEVTVALYRVSGFKPVNDSWWLAFKLPSTATLGGSSNDRLVSVTVVSATRSVPQPITACLSVKYPTAGGVSKFGACVNGLVWVVKLSTELLADEIPAALVDATCK